MNTRVILIFAAVLFEVGSSMPSSLGVSCRDHPGYSEGLKPVLIKSWEVLHGTRTVPGMYLVGYDGHRYAPSDNLTSMEFDRLDWFWVAKGGPARERYVRLSLNRAAKIYMLVPFNRRRTGRNPTLPGWTVEGIVKLAKGVGKPIHYGIYQSSARRLMQTAYLFSRETDGDILLPNFKWLQRVARGIVITGDWTIMIAEIEGTAPILQYPPNPSGVSIPIIPNKRCPDQLHDLWKTRNTDESDEETRGMMWKTWHPQWDPCFWCGYDHEHGSSPKHLMGYEPKFNYAAWKNGRDGESHEGYKGYVFRYESLFIYVMVHMQTSNVRRVSVRHHSILLAATDANTKELLIEVTHKADFGFSGVRGKKGKLFPLSRAGREIHDSQRAEGALRKTRSINVIDLRNLNPYYRYNTRRKYIRRGIYETWTTVPLCSADNKLGVVMFDTVNPATAIKTATTHHPKALTLGHYKYKTFFRQTGAFRLLKLTKFAAGEDHCRFKLKNMGQGRIYPDGSFYTDPYGIYLHDGPSKSSVRQFVKPGFNMKISGKFGAVESWTGLYKDNVFASIVNYGYSINPDIN